MIRIGFASTLHFRDHHCAGFVIANIVYMIQRGMIDYGIASVEDAYAFSKAELKRAGAEKAPIQKDGIPGKLAPSQNL